MIKEKITYSVTLQQLWTIAGLALLAGLCFGFAMHGLVDSRTTSDIPEASDLYSDDRREQERLR